MKNSNLKSIVELENELFNKWKKTRPNLIRDGVVNEDNYLSSKLKVLYILKEVHGNWEMKKHLGKDENGVTWNNIARWQYGIENIDSEMTFEKIRYINRQFRHKYLKNIAVLNIKKEYGGARSKPKELRGYTEVDRELLREQINIYSPDIIICGGIGEILRKNKLVDGFKKWNVSKERKVQYHKTDDLIIINFSHPNASISIQRRFWDLIKTIREIR